MPPPSLLSELDTLQSRLTSRAWAPRLTLLSRILLAVAFLPTGLVKLSGQRFTSLGLDTPIGFFFEAMYRSGVYWRFLGLSQVVAALLLLLPRTAFFGALLFLPIVGNIAILTTALGFTGTPYVTWLMLLANCWLLAWDWPRWRGLFTEGTSRSVFRGWSALETFGWAAGGAALLVVMLAVRGLLPVGTIRPAVGVGIAGGVIVVVAWVRMRGAAAGEASGAPR